MMTHRAFYKLVENVSPLDGKLFNKLYAQRIKMIIGSSPQATTPMTAKHLKAAIQLIQPRTHDFPHLQIIVDTLNDELDKLQPSVPVPAQQALKQVQEELKKLQAEIELLEHDLQQEQAANVQIQQMLNEAQAENKQLKTLIHQLQTQPLSEQLKKLTEMARQLEIDLESEKEARVRAEAKAGAIPTGDGRTVHIHANTVNLNDIHHNDNNNTQIHS